MWKLTNRDGDDSDQVLGVADWQSEGAACSVRADDCNVGVRLLSSSESSRALCRITSVDDEVLPNVQEQFVRGRELHWVMPQAKGTYGVHVAAEPIECDLDCVVLELTLSVQTDLLDTHPKLDIVVQCDQHRSVDIRADVVAGGAPSASVAKIADTEFALLLGPHDSPYTTNLSSDDEIRLRLFGDFLEKGVIRKARPWFVFAGENGLPSDEKIAELWQQLQGSPLPLTP